jgi:hypothetical protein
MSTLTIENVSFGDGLNLKTNPLHALSGFDFTSLELKPDSIVKGKNRKARKEALQEKRNAQKRKRVTEDALEDEKKHQR